MLRRWTALVGILILTSWAGSAAAGVAANNAAPLRVTELTVGGSEVEVAILNLAPESRFGTVTVRVRLGDREMDARASFEVPGGQKAFVILAFPERVREAISCGVILDDGTPF
jgi:hypothetical protein